jgi:hypothetical protein
MLNRLLLRDESIETLMGKISSLGWDSDVELVTLTRDHVANALVSFSNGECEASDVEAWAEAIEGRDDIGLESGHEERLKRIVFEIANPEVSGELSAERAGEWLALLR